MWKVIVATSLSMLLTASWLLSSGIEGNPTPNNWSISDGEIRQLRDELPRRPLVISDDDDASVIDRRHRLRWRFHYHPRQQQHQISHNSINKMPSSKIVKRSAPDILETDPERQSRGDLSTDDNKVAAVENELGQLSETVNSLGNNQTNAAAAAAGNYTKFWGVAKSVDGHEDYVSFQESPLSLLPETTNNNETMAQFFGITNIYVGGHHQQRLINKKQSELITGHQTDAVAVVAAADCPVCPAVVAAVECPTIPEHIILTVTACESFGSSLGTCSVASIAPGGTIFVLFSSSTSVSGSGGGRKSFGRYLKKKNKNNISPSVATAVIGVVASAPNTKVKMTCPYIPTDVTVTTQNGPILPYKPREEAGFIQLIVTGTLSTDKYTMACVWSSSP